MYEQIKSNRDIVVDVSRTNRGLWLAVAVLLVATLATSASALLAIRGMKEAKRQAHEWRVTATEATIAYIESHGGLLPKGTRVKVKDNKHFWVIGYTSEKA
jgi:hypothetical protein